MQDINTIKAVRCAVRAAWYECAIELRPYSALPQPTVKELFGCVTHDAHGLTVIEYN